mmetsp:Transcript_18055/g.32666  ORF Transcript_18055/g.32666 Transcript_18055/m.32666 type:complete len:111 (-) Transcript_18055:11-343(-)
MVECTNRMVFSKMLRYAPHQPPAFTDSSTTASEASANKCEDACHESTAVERASKCSGKSDSVDFTPRAAEWGGAKANDAGEIAQAATRKADKDVLIAINLCLLSEMSERR